MEAKENKYEKLSEDIKSYAKMHYDLLRLEALEKSSRVIALLLVVACVITLSMGAFIYFSFALVFWLRPMFDSYIIPFLILGGTFILMQVILFIFKDKIILNPIIKQLSAIFFRESTGKETHENNQ